LILKIGTSYLGVYGSKINNMCEKGEITQEENGKDAGMEYKLFVKIEVPGQEAQQRM
jgi:hypothetical protein